MDKPISVTGCTHTSPLYNISAEPIECENPSTLVSLYNQTALAGDREHLAEITLRDLAGKTTFIGKQLGHIETVSRMNPFDYASTDQIPFSTKCIDQTLRTFLVGGFEAFCNTGLAVVGTIATLGALLFAAIFALGCAYDSADTCWEGACDFSKYTISYMNQAIRGAIKMIPLVGPTLTKGYDMAQAAILNKIIVQSEPLNKK